LNKEINTKSSKALMLIKFLWVVFGVSSFISIIDFIYVIFIRRQLFDKVPTIFALIFLFAFGIAGLSFLFVMFLHLVKWQSGKNKVTFLRVILAFLTLPILPLYLLIKPFRDNQKFYLKIVKSLVPFVLTAPVWLLGYVILYYVATDEVFLGTRYQITPLAETSSMAPSFSPGTIGKYYPYKNFIYKLDKNNAYKFQRGDVITFSNPVTVAYLEKAKINNQSGFIKRVIGLPGDTIELKAGVVVVNGQPSVEQYTMEANSTFGLDYTWPKENGLHGLFLKDCQKITVPARELFVLGDNRKNSTDSRYIGSVSFDDVHGYYPLAEQKKPYYEGINLINNSANWRDTSNDLNSKVLLDISSYCKN
jgi:signal peptidase I